MSRNTRGRRRGGGIDPWISPRAEALQGSGPGPGTSPGGGATLRQRITPEAGKLLMFHSWFEHEVEPNGSDEERISIAFNVMLHGRVGYESGGAEF